MARQMPYAPEHKQVLLRVARDSIEHGLRSGRPLPVRTDDYPEPLCEIRAAFVTLQLLKKLRGCIGTLQAVRPLAEDVAENAFAAAFRDPRFAPMNDSERMILEIHISVLSPSEPIEFTGEEQLLDSIRPKVDGLIIEDGARRGTFLPSVWETLPDPRDFFRHLKMKAGLPPDYWSETIAVSRYTAESIE